MGQALGDAVEIGLAADQPDIGVLLGLPHQMLAGAEADLEPDLARAEQRRQIELLRRGWNGDEELGQQGVEQGFLPGPKLLAATAAVERALTGLGFLPILMGRWRVGIFTLRVKMPYRRWRGHEQRSRRGLCPLRPRTHFRAKLEN